LARDIRITHFDDIANFERERWDRDLAAIHFDVPVVNHLPRSRASVCKAKMIDHVIEARLQNLQHVLARDAAAAQGAFVYAAELTLLQAIEITEFLLFHQ